MSEGVTVWWRGLPARVIPLQIEFVGGIAWVWFRRQWHNGPGEKVYIAPAI